MDIVFLSWGQFLIGLSMYINFFGMVLHASTPLDVGLFFRTINPVGFLNNMFPFETIFKIELSGVQNLWVSRVVFQFGRPLKTYIHICYNCSLVIFF
jgi:hypothetical protein